MNASKGIHIFNGLLFAGLVIACVLVTLHDLAIMK